MEYESNLRLDTSLGNYCFKSAENLNAADGPCSSVLV